MAANESSRPTAAPTSLPEGQLRWLLRRGMKELDVLTERYYAGRWPEAPQAERETFVRILRTVEDPDLYSWAMGYTAPPAEFADVVQQLRRHR